MITCIHNSGNVKSDSDDLGKPKTPNTPEKFYFPRVSALILHSEGQISITVSLNADIAEPAAQITELCRHLQRDKLAVLGFCGYILINAEMLILHNHTSKQEHLHTGEFYKTQ